MILTEEISRTHRVACIGECMVELRERFDGSLHRSFGGDTLNTALYLARLGVSVDYVTALGDDDWSLEMITAWREEGIRTDLVQRLPGRLAGLYVIHTDEVGERRFLYWRDNAAARSLFDDFDMSVLDIFDTLYLSGITLSIYTPDARAKLFQAIVMARTRGARIVFDTNFRPRGWPDLELARRTYEQMLGLADIVLASVEDLALLYHNEQVGERRLFEHASRAEIVLKLVYPASLVSYLGRQVTIHAEPVAAVVDTTAAGDSFAAAYLAARLSGATPEVAARAGHTLAGIVVGHPGAIVPRVAMPIGLISENLP